MSNKWETSRLEALWSGNFGDDYVVRNRGLQGRALFWDMIIAKTGCSSILEVGCNVGANLGCLSSYISPRRMYGVDINLKALSELKETLWGINAVCSRARKLPFRDEAFELTFTTGVLIHQSRRSLPHVMDELVRCSAKWILCGEYYAEQLTEVEYRGHTGALFKQDYGQLYLELFPDLKMVDKGFLSRANGGWDDVTWWLFER